MKKQKGYLEGLAETMAWLFVIIFLVSVGVGYLIGHFL